MATGSISVGEFKSLLARFVDTSNKINDKWHLEERPNVPVFASKRCLVQPRDMRKHQAGIDKTAPNTISSQRDILPSAFPSTQKDSCNELKTENDVQTNDTDYQKKPQPSSRDDGLQKEDLPDDSGMKRDMEEDVFAEMDLEMETEGDSQCMQSVPEEVLTYEYHIVYSESYQVPVLYFNVYKTDGSLMSLEQVWSLCPSWHQEMLRDNKWTTLTQQEHPLLGRPYLQLHPCHTAEFMSQVYKGEGSDRSRNYLVTWLSTVAPMVGLVVPQEYLHS